MNTCYLPFESHTLDPTGQKLHRRVLQTGIAMDVVRSSGTRTPHRHQCLEIVFIHAGTTIWSVGGRCHVLVPGDVVVFNADSIHSSRPVHGQYVRTGIHFLADLVSPRLLSILPGPHEPPWVVSLPTSVAHQVYHQLQHLRRLTQRSPRHQQAQELLAHILGEIASCAHRYTESRSDDKQVLDRALRYMSSNLESDEGLEELARRVYVSEGHLCHLFRKEFGCSPMRLWQMMKIEHICASDHIEVCSVDELARRTGFATRRGFERAFRRVTGTTVSNFRSLLASG